MGWTHLGDKKSKHFPPFFDHTVNFCWLPFTSIMRTHDTHFYHFSCSMLDAMMLSIIWEWVEQREKMKNNKKHLTHWIFSLISSRILHSSKNIYIYIIVYKETSPACDVLLSSPFVLKLLLLLLFFVRFRAKKKLYERYKKNMNYVREGGINKFALALETREMKWEMLS